MLFRLFKKGYFVDFLFTSIEGQSHYPTEKIMPLHVLFALMVFSAL